MRGERLFVDVVLFEHVEIWVGGNKSVGIVL